MNIVIPDDYQNAVRNLQCFSKLKEHNVKIFNDSVKDVKSLTGMFKDADAIVLIRERTKITSALISHLPKLKFISQTGRGVSHVDLQACNKYGILVSAGSGSPHSTAELTWALVLSSIRKIPQEVAALKKGKWQTTIGTGLNGKTLGIWGYGRIGKLVAGYGRAFGMNVLVWGREGSISRAAEDGLQTADSKKVLFRHSDVLSIHIKLNETTKGIISENDLLEMKKDSLFVNTSRAELAAKGALISALGKGRPGFAAVDVYEEEPADPSSNPLIKMENVICTPHIGYVEKDSYELYFSQAFDQINAFAENNPINVINTDIIKSDSRIK